MFKYFNKFLLRNKNLIYKTAYKMYVFVKPLLKCMYFASEMYVHLKIIGFDTILPTFH